MDKYIIMFSNQIRFDSGQLGNDAFVKDSLLEWITINTQAAVSIPYSMTTSFAKLQDEDIDLETLTEIEYDGLFEMKKMH